MANSLRTLRAGLAADSGKENGCCDGRDKLCPVRESSSYLGFLGFPVSIS